jgi:hypothetical protein
MDVDSKVNILLGRPVYESWNSSFPIENLGKKAKFLSGNEQRDIEFGFLKSHPPHETAVDLVDIPTVSPWYVTKHDFVEGIFEIISVVNTAGPVGYILKALTAIEWHSASIVRGKVKGHSVTSRAPAGYYFYGTVNCITSA